MVTDYFYFVLHSTFYNYNNNGYSNLINVMTDLYDIRCDDGPNGIRYALPGSLDDNNTSFWTPS